MLDVDWKSSGSVEEVGLVEAGLTRGVKGIAAGSFMVLEMLSEFSIGLGGWILGIPVIDGAAVDARLAERCYSEFDGGGVANGIAGFAGDVAAIFNLGEELDERDVWIPGLGNGFSVGFEVFAGGVAVFGFEVVEEFQRATVGEA